LERVPEPAINRAAQTLFDLSETWEVTTQEKRQDLVHVMIQEVGDIINKNPCGTFFILAAHGRRN